MEITRHIDWNVSFWMLAFLYAGSFLAFGVSGFRLYSRVRVWKAGPSLYGLRPRLREH